MARFFGIQDKAVDGKRYEYACQRFERPVYDIWHRIKRAACVEEYDDCKDNAAWGNRVLQV